MLDCSAQRLPRGGITNFALEACPLPLQADAPGVEGSESLRLADSDRAPPHDRKSNQHEDAEYEAYQGPAPECYAAFRHARSLALRERGFTPVSAGLATSARLVMSSPSALPRQVHWSCFGGQMQSRLHSRIVCLTSLSSPEW